MTGIFCDGFESGDLGAWTGYYTVDGWFQVDAPFANSGAWGAQGVLPSYGAGMSLWKTFADRTDAWARVYLRVDAFSQNEDDAAYGLCLSDGTIYLGAGIVLRWNDGLRLHLRYRDNTAEDFFEPALSGTFGALVALNEWHCVELHAVAGAGSGLAELYLDGLPVAAVSGLTNDLCSTAQLTLALVTQSGMADGAAVSHDDAAVDAGRIGPLRGFRVYDNAGTGPIDYAAARAMLPESLASWTSPALACPAAWRFGVRACNEYGEEKNLNVAVGLTLLGSGLVPPARPNRPTNLAARPAEGGKIALSFSYDATGETAACTHFHVYSNGGAGEIDYESAIGSVATDDAGPRTHYEFLTGALADGVAHRFAVRAAAASDVEDDGIESVAAIPDASAPLQPASLSAGVVR